MLSIGTSATDFALPDQNGEVRTSCFIDENGIIRAFDKVKAADNPMQMLEQL